MIIDMITVQYIKSNKYFYFMYWTVKENIFLCLILIHPWILFEHNMLKINSLFLNLNISWQNLLAISVTTASAEQNFFKKLPPI